MKPFRVKPEELERAAATLGAIAEALGNSELKTPGEGVCGHEGLARALRHCGNTWERARQNGATRIHDQGADTSRVAEKYRQTDAEVAARMCAPSGNSPANSGNSGGDSEGKGS